MTLSNIDSLKRYLFALPAEHDFCFNNDVRKSIRRELFMAISNRGKYLHWLFPNIYDDKTSEKDLNNKFKQLDEEFEWKFSNYYKLNLHGRDPKYNTHNHHAFHSSLPCSRIFRKGEPIYRCLTCGYDDTCALCSHCYQPEFHQGHKVHITICLRENGGVCDCGDPEAWVNEFHCPYASKDGDSTEIRNSDLPEELVESFSATIGVLLDFVIDIMSRSDLQYLPHESMDQRFIEYYSMASGLDSLAYGYQESEAIEDINSPDYFLMVYNDQIRHYRDAIQRIRLASKRVQDFAIMVTDRVQSYGKGRVVSSKNIAHLQERQKILAATGLATSIRSHRDVFREDMCDEILVWINSLTESEMFKTYNQAKNLFCIAFCSRWKSGLKTSVGVDELLVYNTGRLDILNQIPKIPALKKQHENKESQHWKFEPSMWPLQQDICEECDYNLNVKDYELNTNHLGSRLQYLIYMDIRFWRSIRSLLHDMYSTSLITNLKYKKIISYQYVDIYPVVADMFLTMDREPELNIMSTLSTQLFTCPSNSTCIVQHGDLSRVFASIYGFLTVEQIKSPQDLEVCHEVSLRSLKNRRWGQIFFDIGYILSRSRHPAIILSPEVIGMACDILALFQGRPVLKREGEAHVEYESPDYTAFFHAILVIYQFGEFLAQCLNRIQEMKDDQITKISNEAVSYVYEFLLKLEQGQYPGLEDASVDVDLHKSKEFSVDPVDGTAIQLFDISKDKVSFLHPIHSLLSWLIELSSFSSVSDIKGIFEQSMVDHANQLQLKTYIPQTFIFEYSIRTIVLMSQIKTGFWVRNGFSVKSQLQLYKSTSLRESGYMRDIFMTQIFAIMASPSLFCYTVLSRWLLLYGYVMPSNSETLQELEFDGRVYPKSTRQITTEVPYEKKNIPVMVEECINFFIHLLCEDIHLRKLSNQQITENRIENEIIHNLCFGQMSYTKLCSTIPDHIIAEKRFDIILEDLTIFTPPNNAKDVGTYRLKDEFFSRINPYYFNYSTNTKEDAVKLVKEKLCSRKKLKPEEIVIKPKLRDPQELGIFRFIGNFSTSQYFIDFIIRTLILLLEEGPDCRDESVLETLLHLIHVCSFENNLDIQKYGSFYHKFISKSEIFNVSMAEVLYQVLLNEHFKSHHSKTRAIFAVFGSKYDIISSMSFIPSFQEQNLKDSGNQDYMESETDRKRRVAKEKQAKLMAKFKKQQSLFLKNNMMNSVDMSDTEMEDSEKTGWRFPENHCMLCQNTSQNNGPFGIIAHVSKSSEFRTVPFDNKYWFLKAFSDTANLDVDESEKNENVFTEKWKNYIKKIDEDNVIGPGFKQAEHIDNKLVSQSCGHGMHFQCYMVFLNSNKNKLNQITRNAPENIDHKEFLCPLCKAIGNMFVPIMSTHNDRDLVELLTPGEIDKGDLSSFKSLLKFETDKHQWFQEFTNRFKNDLIQWERLTPQAKHSLQSTGTLSGDQVLLREALAHIEQLMKLFSFPNMFKKDAAEIIANTIKATEISLRGETSNETLVTQQLSNNVLINLRSLQEYRITSLYLGIQEGVNPFIATLGGIRSFYDDSLFYKNVLQKDFFELLTSMFPVPSAGFLFNLLLKACFMGQIIQNVLLLVTQIINHDFYQCEEYSILDVPAITTVDEDRASAAVLLFKKVKRILHPDDDEDMISNDQNFGFVFYSMLIKSCTPFLRRAAILAFVASAEDKNIEWTKFHTLFLEADRLCSLMNIENMYDFILKFISEDASFERERFDKFFESYKVSEKFMDNEDLIQMDYPGLIKLIDLPERLDYFFTKFYYLDKYNNPHMSIEDPAICLFCGEVMDAQKCALGKKFGECTTHYLTECLNNVGIFLLPKDKTILLLHKNGGSFMEAPYLDQHGELPDESKRSKTLYLMTPRYNNLIKHIWLEHNVSNIIVRKLDSVIDAGGWDTL